MGGTIFLLGVPRASSEFGSNPNFPTKAWVLLTMLALGADRTESKAALSRVLFPDSDDPNAALRQLLRRTRSLLGAGAVKSQGSYLQLGDIETDLETLMAVQAIDDESEASKFVRIESLLTSLEVEEHDARLWLETQRRRVRHHIHQLVLIWSDKRPPAAAIGPLQTLLESDPGDAVLTGTVVDLLLRLGHRLEALRAVENYAAWHTGDDAVANVVADLKAKVAPVAPQTLDSAFSAPPQAAIERRGTPRLVLLRPTGADASMRPILDSLVEDLAIELVGSREVAVIAPNTAWRLAEEPSGLQRLPSLADFAVSFRLRLSAGAHPIVGLSLMNLSSREILWGEHRVLDEAGERNGYSETIRSMLGAILGSIEAAELLQLRRTGLPTAYRAYLMGRHYLRTLDLRDIRRARRWFRQAAAIDPDYARPHSWHGHTLILEWLMLTGSQSELLDAAIEEARLAIELDPLDPNGHRILARARLFQGFMDESLEGLARAERLGPHFADLLADYADTLAHHSAAEEAKQKIDLAIHLNPIPPDTYLWIAAGADFALGDFSGALDKLKRMSNHDQVYRLMAASAAMLGDREAAHQYRNEALSIDPTFEIRKWIQRLPIRRREHLELYVSALHKAGFQ